MGRVRAEEVVVRPEAPSSESDFEALTPAEAIRRQLYLEAFQVPAAIVGLHAEAVRTAAFNEAFRAVIGEDIGAVSELAEPVREFLLSDTAACRMDWHQNGAGGRHFQVHMARLGPVGTLAGRSLVSLVDRTTEIEAARALRREILRDGLTGLPNRAAYFEAVKQAIEAHGEQAGFALIAVDLVRFSRVNEGLGALAGDELIRTVADRLRATLTPDALLARTSGDEFGVLLRLRDGPGDAIHVARQLQASFAQPIRLSDLEIKIDGAIGCAFWCEHLETAGDVLGNVQVALKQAKTSGRIEVYQPGEVAQARRSFSLETRLRRAIENDRLSLAFQPLLDLRTGAVSGFEALARWTDPDHGAVSPVEFIPVAEESGLIVPLGRWALSRAARTLEGWDAQAGRTLPIRVSVNVSPVQLTRDSLADAVDASGMDAGRLTLELTESSIVADPARASKVLEALHERACEIAMDDFGTGYSCLAYLQRLPIDVLKIDRSLVSDMHENRDSRAIVRAVLGLARALGMSTVAEGIERTETASMLGTLGCAVGQGFHFAPPLAPDAALAYLLSRNA